MNRFAIGLLGLVGLIEQLSSFLVMQIAMFEVDPQLLTSPMTTESFMLMWVYITPITFLGLTVLLCFIDFFFLQLRFSKIAFFASIAHLAVIVFWLGVGIIYGPIAEIDVVFSSLLNTSQLPLLIGAIGSSVLLGLLRTRETETGSASN